MKITPLKKNARPGYALKIAALLTAAASVAGCAEHNPATLEGDVPMTEEVTENAGAKGGEPVTEDTSKPDYTEDIELAGEETVIEDTALAGDIAPIEDETAKAEETTAKVTAAAAAVTTAATTTAAIFGTSPVTEDEICELDGDVAMPEDEGLVLDGGVEVPEDETELGGVVAPDEETVDQLYGIKAGSQLYDDLKEIDYALRMVYSRLDDERSYNLSYESGTTQYGFTCWRVVDNKTNALTTNFIAFIEDEDFEKLLKKDGAQRFGYVGGNAANNFGFYGYISKARVSGVGNANVAFLTIADPNDRPEENSGIITARPEGYAEFIVDALAAYGFFSNGVDEEEALPNEDEYEIVELDGDVAVEEEPAYTPTDEEIFASDNADVLRNAFKPHVFSFVTSGENGIRNGSYDVTFDNNGNKKDSYFATVYYEIKWNYREEEDGAYDFMYISFAEKGSALAKALSEQKDAIKVKGGYIVECEFGARVKVLFIIVDDFVDPIKESSANALVDSLVKEGVIK